MVEEEWLRNKPDVRTNDVGPTGVISLKIKSLLIEQRVILLGETLGFRQLGLFLVFLLCDSMAWHIVCVV